MNAPVELPGEASPLTIQTLAATLQAASSSSSQQVQVSTSQLQNWEAHDNNYYGLLQDVFMSPELPLNVRYLSIIQIKNGIDKYWRSTNPSSPFTPATKTSYRSHIIENGINEPDGMLALHNALTIAKIVRIEFPNKWPNAIGQVLEYLRVFIKPGAPSLQLARTLQILLQIIKELSTARIQRSRTSLQSVSPEILQVLGRFYVEKVQNWTTKLNNNEQETLEEMNYSLLAIRILRRLLISGFEHQNRIKDIQEFWSVLRDHQGQFWTILSQKQQYHKDYIQALERHLLQISKLHIDMVRSHPAGFVLLPGSVGLFQSYWGLIHNFSETFSTKSQSLDTKTGGNDDDDDGEKSLSEKLCLKGLLLFRACFKMVFSPILTFKYQHPEDKEERKQSVQLMKEQVLTNNLVLNMMETIVTKFFVFRASDLRDWEADPDEWERAQEGEGDAWEFTVRGCSEKLFLDMMINFKTVLVEPLLNVFKTVATPQNHDILLKDSMYAAIGHAAAVLESHLDFDSFLSGTLVPEVQIREPGYNILRRRIAILLGQWVPVKINGLNRPLVYQVFQYLLDKNDSLNDQVVRVTAGKQFKYVADPFEFVTDDFMPFAPNILDRLMSLIEEVSLTETKMALLDTVRVLVAKMEDKIDGFSDRIVSILPSLWDGSGEDHLMKQAILATLTAITHSMTNGAVRYHPLILPLIQSAVEPDSESQVYLLEDALDLWYSIVVQSSVPAQQELLKLITYLFPILEHTGDNLRKALDITESYLLLAPETMLADDLRPHFISSFANLLDSLKREAICLITHLTELFLLLGNRIGGGAANDIIARDFMSSGFLTKIFTGLRDAWDAHQTTGPNRKYSDLDVVVETEYLSMLARLTLANPNTFVASVAALCQTRNESFDQMIKWVLAEWFSHFDSMVDIAQKKLSCLAFAQLLSLHTPWILERLQDLFVVFTDTILDLQEEGISLLEGKIIEGGSVSGGDCLVYSDIEKAGAEDEPEAPEAERRRQVAFADPIHRINLRELVGEKMKEAVIAAGGMEVFQREWLVNVDAEVANSFAALGIL